MNVLVMLGYAQCITSPTPGGTVVNIDAQPFDPDDQGFIDEHMRAVMKRFRAAAMSDPEHQFGLLRTLIDSLGFAMMAESTRTSYWAAMSLIRTASWTNFTENAAAMDAHEAADWEKIGAPLRKGPEEAREYVMRARQQDRRYQ